jgi:hypothetical protein
VVTVIIIIQSSFIKLYGGSDDEMANNPLVITNKLLAKREQVIPLLVKTLEHSVVQDKEHVLSTNVQQYDCSKCAESHRQQTSILVSKAQWFVGRREMHHWDDKGECFKSLDQVASNI